jgi:ketosteroid isomerase-like protein
LPERAVDLHRRFYTPFNAHDIEGWIAQCDPDIEFHSAFAVVGGVTVYRGHDGLREWYRGYDEVWGDDIRVELDAFFDLGEETMAFFVLRGRGRQSGIETAMSIAQVARWRDGLCVYLKSYLDRRDALHDVGVTEDQLERISP